jgi:hypothetical protein
MAVGGADGGIVGAEALLSSSTRSSSPNTAQLPKPPSMAWILAMTASMRAKRGAAYASSCHATLPSVKDVVNGGTCNGVPEQGVELAVAASWRCCLLALLANALSHAVAQHCLLALSASAFSCAAARRCLLALSASAFSCAAAQRCSLASSANAFSRAAARRCSLASSASAFSCAAA